MLVVLHPQGGPHGHGEGQVNLYPASPSQENLNGTPLSIEGFLFALSSRAFDRKIDMPVDTPFL